MLRFDALAFSLALAFADPATPGVQSTDGQAETHNDSTLAAFEERHARERARRECNTRGGEMRQRVIAGTADPQREADAAISQGCFGLAHTIWGIPFGTSYAYGVECRPNGLLLDFNRLGVFFYAGSDVPGSLEDERRRASEAVKLRAFALIYNRLIVAHRDFPYKDLCRAAADEFAPGNEEEFDPGSAGFRQLDETDTPINVHEAARRGTLASLQRLIATTPFNVHLQDLLDLTPLAWAVIYNRPEHVRFLLDSGAHPYGHMFVDQPSPRSPITIARETRNRAITEILRPALAARGLTQPGVRAKLDRARSEPQLLAPGLNRRFMLLQLTISAEGQIVACERVYQDIEGTDGLCEQAQRGLMFFPAEDEEGRPVSGQYRAAVAFGG